MIYRASFSHLVNPGCITNLYIYSHLNLPNYVLFSSLLFSSLFSVSHVLSFLLSSPLLSLSQSLVSLPITVALSSSSAWPTALLTERSESSIGMKIGRGGSDGERDEEWGELTYGSNGAIFRLNSWQIFLEEGWCWRNEWGACKRCESIRNNTDTFNVHPYFTPQRPKIQHTVVSTGCLLHSDCAIQKLPKQFSDNISFWLGHFW